MPSGAASGKSRRKAGQWRESKMPGSVVVFALRCEGKKSALERQGHGEVRTYHNLSVKHTTFS